MAHKKDFLLKFIVAKVVKFDLSLVSSIVIFTFTSLGSKECNIILRSIIYNIAAAIV